MATNGDKKIYVKTKSFLPDYEDFDYTKWYALTINPSDKFQYFANPHRISLCIKDIKETILFYKYILFELYMEISPKGRIHWHGRIGFDSQYDVTMFYIFAVHGLLTKSTVVIKDIDDNDKWTEYITKQKDFHRYIKDMYHVKMPIQRMDKQDAYCDLFIDISTD